MSKQFIYHAEDNKIVEKVATDVSLILDDNALISYPCSDACKSLWKDGQEVEEGKDFKVVMPDGNSIGQFHYDFENMKQSYTSFLDGIATPLPQTEVGEDELLANNSKPEYIICAAIHFLTDITHEHQPRNITQGFVVCGRRHHNCFVIASLINKGLMNNAEQGFLTSKDRFVSRKNAGKIAFGQKQISEPTDCLFSEDLY